jgi:Lar family restriction alleviation protein
MMNTNTPSSGEGITIQSTTMSNTEQLLPCPFCGGEAVYFPQEYPDKTFHAVKCKNCYIVWEGHPTKSAAIEKWNTRAALSPPQAVDEKGIREAAEELYPFNNANDRHHLENVIAKHEQDAYIKGRLHGRFQRTRRTRCPRRGERSALYQMRTLLYGRANREGFGA